MWALQQVIEYLDTSTARRIWEEELVLVTKMLHRDRRNFHAWTYRRHVILNLESSALDGSSLVEPEFEYTTQKIRDDLSNFSAWHNRSKLIPRLLDERHCDGAERRKFLESELDYIRDGLNVGPEDQSLWYYHQFLVSNITSQQGQSCFVPDLSDLERTKYIYRELDDIKDLLEDYADIKLIYEALLGHTLAIAKIEGRKLNDPEKAETSSWLSTLKRLDPKRQGRWSEMNLDPVP